MNNVVQQVVGLDSNGVLSEVTLKKYDRELSKIALWDTGAATTTISSECAKQLELKPINEEFLKLNPDAVKSYRVKLIINNEITLGEVLVVSRDEVFEGFDMLIGMDIISKGRFAIVREPNHISFSYSLR